MFFLVNVKTVLKNVNHMANINIFIITYHFKGVFLVIFINF